MNGQEMDMMAADFSNESSDDWTFTEGEESCTFNDEDSSSDEDNNIDGTSSSTVPLVRGFRSTDGLLNGLQSRQLNLLSDITKMKQELKQASSKGHNILAMLSSEKNRDDASIGTTHSAMSVNAIAKLKGQTSISSNIKKSASTTHLPRRVIDITQETSAQDEYATDFIAEDESLVVKPHDCLLSILQSEGVDRTEPRPASTIDDFFFEWTEDNITAYEADLVAAIRSNSVHTVQMLHQQGKKLLCCNKFGESVVHMICRRGSTELLKYFMGAGVTIRLKCDSGRTPLHDACWTGKPNFDCVKLVLEECPDMLLISDNRGFTPLSYVPRNMWGSWCAFLEQNKHLLKPRELV